MTLGLIVYYYKGDNNRSFMSISIGRLKDWWSTDSSRKFLEKAECVIDFYSNMSVEIEGKNYPIDGERTQGENIADLGGVMQSYSAFGKSLCIYYYFIFLKNPFFVSI